MSDMWRNYLDVIQEFVPNAVRVLDRFHVMKKFNEALDEIRREETRELRVAGYETVLRKARWCLLKRPENLTDRQTTSLREILKHNLKTVRAWLSREDFQRFWEYSSPAWAGKFLDEWTDRTMRTRLQPLMSVAEMLRRHKPLLLNWFRARGEFSECGRSRTPAYTWEAADPASHPQILVKRLIFVFPNSQSNQLATKKFREELGV